MPDDQGNRKLEAALDELRVINTIIDRICRVRETNHIMSIIIDELVKATEAGQGVVNLIAPNRDADFVTIVRSNQPGSAEIPYKVGNLLSGWVMKHKTVLKVDDLDTDDRFPGLSSDGGRFKSVLCCPMVVRGEVIGLTSLVRDKTVGPFRNDHARLAGIVASQSAQVLSNAMLLEELARKKELLELSQQKLREENVRLRTEIDTSLAFENIVGKSQAMRKVLTLASKVSANDSPVLITGPTGTGKELIAQAIHHHSRRRDKPFVIKNCGLKTESLLESELFGHVRGAFTGADRNKPGLFREADGGTVFLDEIGDAPLSTQVAILRVLETGEIRAVGASKTEFVDVRVISATNKELAALIDKGQFRRDLFYRLNTLTIEVPPLSHRPEDIPLLVHHCLKKLKIKLDVENLSVVPEALEALCRYSWPGNVRELEHAIERAAVVCSIDGAIDVCDLPPSIRGLSGKGPDLKSGPGRLRDVVEKVERDLIADTLAENKGNILRTSKALGLTRKGLKDKMARYGIAYERDQ
jgi:transcriptional regulator with GAF, ATPase, and Fis domain